MVRAGVRVRVRVKDMACLADLDLFEYDTQRLLELDNDLGHADRAARSATQRGRTGRRLEDESQRGCQWQRHQQDQVGEAHPSGFTLPGLRAKFEILTCRFVTLETAKPQEVWKTSWAT